MREGGYTHGDIRSEGGVQKYTVAGACGVGMREGMWLLGVEGAGGEEGGEEGGAA